MLDEEYRQVLFWFSPYSYSAAASADRTLPPDVQARLDADTAWLVTSRPAVGQERKLRWGTFPGTADSIPLDEQWPRVGCWQITAFPRTVVWLKRWIRDAQREIAALQARWDGNRPPLEKRKNFLVQTHRHRVERRRYLGDKPVQDRIKISEAQNVRTSHGGYTIPAKFEKEQWYDQVEELDQTHADRRLELANELVNLPPFTAYVRTASGQHHVALTPPADANIDESRIEWVRQASKMRFGRPPGSPVPPAASVTEPEGPLGPPPANLRIPRYLEDDE